MVQQFGVKLSFEQATSLTLPASTALLPVRARVPSLATDTVAGSSADTGADPVAGTSEEARP